MNILITGSSGYLGRFLMNHIDRKKYSNIICLINSEKRYKENDYLYTNCKIYKGDISNKEFVKNIFSENKIDLVIHTAAMKYIDTCEKFQQQCIDTNIIGTLNICEQAKKYNVKNVITISTDKANNPVCLYGISKLASERITISHGYSVYQGVNFWNSDGSFTQKWKTIIRNKETVNLYNDKHIRFFSDPNDTALEILNLVEYNIDSVDINRTCRGSRYYPSKCWKIKIVDIFNILKEQYPDIKFIVKSSEENNFDKTEEEINEFTKVEYISEEKLKELLDPIFK